MTKPGGLHFVICKDCHEYRRAEHGQSKRCRECIAAFRNVPESGPGEKYCRGCYTVKPLEDFYRRKSDGKVLPTCKCCRIEVQQSCYKRRLNAEWLEKRGILKSFT